MARPLPRGRDLGPRPTGRPILLLLRADARRAAHRPIAPAARVSETLRCLADPTPQLTSAHEQEGRGRPSASYKGDERCGPNPHHPYSPERYLAANRPTMDDRAGPTFETRSSASRASVGFGRCRTRPAKIYAPCCSTYGRMRRREPRTAGGVIRHQWRHTGRPWRTDFAGFARVTIDVAARLYGSGSAEATAVTEAWSAVGVI